MTRLQKIEARKAEIRALLQGDTPYDLKELEGLEEELRDLDNEKQQIEKRKTLAAGIAATTGAAADAEPVPGGTNPAAVDPQTEARKAREQRGQALKENRSVTVGSSNIVLPKHDDPNIAPTFNEVSSLVDRVNTEYLPGGESYTKPYEAGGADGGYTAEGAAYTTADQTFDYAVINKTKITAYSEESEETQKLPAADYDSVIVGGIRKSLRRKITKEILVGDGATGHYIGIFDDGATAIDPATDIEITAVDKDTLDTIIYGFGGNEDVEDPAVLILNKKDLKAFATLRDAQDRKVYDVVNRGNTGTINGVPFIINSACKAISDAATAAGAYVMAYGPLSNYTVAIFSDVDVQRSTDFKFSTGMIAHKGVVFSGGNVTAKNGFLRIKKDDGV